MDDYLFDDDGMSKQGSVSIKSDDGIDDDLANMNAMLQQGLQNKSPEFQAAVAKSKKAGLATEAAKMAEKKSGSVASDEVYEEEGFEEMSPSPVVQSAKAEGPRSSVNFSGAAEETKDSQQHSQHQKQRPKSSPAKSKNSSSSSSSSSSNSYSNGSSQRAQSAGGSSTKLPPAMAESKGGSNSPPGSPAAGSKDAWEDREGEGEGSKGSPGRRNRPSTAGDVFKYSTPGYSIHSKTHGRKVLEGVLADIYERKAAGPKGKMKVYESALPTGQVVRHQRWKYDDDGVKIGSTAPVAMSMSHHDVHDYRTFRPTSANKRLMPSRPRTSEEYLLPGQRRSTDSVTNAFDGTKLRKFLHNTMAAAMTKVEVSFQEWEIRITDANTRQVDRLRAIHKEEMQGLIDGFDSYRPSETMVRLMVAEKFPAFKKGKKVIITQEQIDYVQKHLYVQSEHNEARMHVLRTKVKNRQRDEVIRVKANTRAPGELLDRTRQAQEETLRAVESKITSKIIHASKIIESVNASIDPTVLLRAQRAAEHCLKFARKGIMQMQETCDRIDDVFEEACKDYMIGDHALREAALPGSSLDPNVDGTFKGTGTAKKDTIRPHSGSFTPQVYDRNINGYRYRSRSPPRGAFEKDIETKQRLTRPKVLSARRGKLQRGYQDFLIEQQKQPYSSKQYGKGRGDEDVELPGLWTTARFKRETARMRETLEDDRPTTAPAGGMFDTAGTLGLDGTTPPLGAEGEGRGEKVRPKTAIPFSPDTEKKGGKSKSNTTANAASWDPSTMHVEVAMDDDASLGIAHDMDDEASLADSIGEGGSGVAPLQLKDEELEEAKRQKRLSMMTNKEVLAHAKREADKKLMEKRAKKFAPKQRIPPNPTDELCAECDEFFDGKIYTIPIIGVNPGMQERFREKQMAEHQRTMKMRARNNTEKMQKRMVSARKKVMQQYNVDPNRYGMKVFCSWKCVRKNALHTCHASMRFDVDTLITLCSGSVGE
jgi:hypothetical protein